MSAQQETATVAKFYPQPRDFFGPKQSRTGNASNLLLEFALLFHTHAVLICQGQGGTEILDSSCDAFQCHAGLGYPSLQGGRLLRVRWRSRRKIQKHVLWLQVRVDDTADNWPGVRRAWRYQQRNELFPLSQQLHFLQRQYNWRVSRAATQNVLTRPRLSRIVSGEANEYKGDSVGRVGANSRKANPRRWRQNNPIHARIK